jgi:hypothetical protein
LSGAATVLAPSDIATMTTVDSYNAAPSSRTRDGHRPLGRLRDRAVAGLPVLALVIVAVALLYLRIRLYLPL